MRKSKWSAPLSYGHYYPATPKIPTRRRRRLNWSTVLGVVMILASWAAAYAVCLHYWPR